MNGYYREKLSGDRLRRCYEIAPARVKQYLEAEIEFVLSKIDPGDIVLDLGCGYGRILSELCSRSRSIVGIDTSQDSLNSGCEVLRSYPNCRMLAMDAVKLGFRKDSFDLTVCIQNGISAFHVNQHELMKEAIRVTRTGGTVLFSTYSHNFWDERLDWFRRQADAGLVGEIDEAKSVDGVIICKDGFKATTLDESGFRELIANLPVDVCIREVDDSSLFCVMTCR